MVNGTGVPVLETPPFSKVGITEKVATKGLDVLLIAVNGSIIPVPSSVAVNPISSPVTDHVKLVVPPWFIDSNTTCDVRSPLQTVWLSTEAIPTTGLTITV